MDPEIRIVVDATMSQKQLDQYRALFDCSVCAHSHADHDRDGGPCFVHGCTCREFL